MQYTVKTLIEQQGFNIEQTKYAKSLILDFLLSSKDKYKWINDKLCFKDSVTIIDFEQLTNLIPVLNSINYKGHEKFPYFVNNLDIINDALSNKETIAVEGGPCLFSTHEVDIIIKTNNNRTFEFDYANGKSYSNNLNDLTLAQCLLINKDNVSSIIFQNHKTSLSEQEYMQLVYPFEIAAKLNGPLVIPLPDMSYKKYLISVLNNVRDDIKQGALKVFDNILKDIVQLYLKEISKLQEKYQIKNLTVIHLGTKDLLNIWYDKRTAYIDKVKFLKSLTSHVENFEAVKDYVSMPALPYYLFGSKYILMVDSMDETDSYRKCKKQHKNSFVLGCILIPELLSKNNEDTIYNAPLRDKIYLS